VTPDSFGDADETVREGIQTGKLPLAETLRAELDELYALAETLAEADSTEETDQTTDDGSDRETDQSTDGTRNEILDRLQRSRNSAEAAVNAAEDGEGELADEWLFSVDIVLQDVRDRLASESQGGYDDDAVAALDPRVAAAIERTNAAIDADL
jgi:hypothetical protein